MTSLLRHRRTTSYDSLAILATYSAPPAPTVYHIVLALAIVAEHTLQVCKSLQKFLQIFSSFLKIIYFILWTRDVIYTSRAYATMSVSVCLSVTEVHWRIIANLGFKFRSQFTAHCRRGLAVHA